MIRLWEVTKSVAPVALAALAVILAIACGQHMAFTP